MIVFRCTRLTWLLVVVIIVACARRPVRELVPPSQIGKIQPSDGYLKAHMRNGSVYIFSSWTIDSDARLVAGNAKVLGINRDLLGQDHYQVSVDSVAIFETDKVVTSPIVVAMAVVTGASLAVTAACASNPKACFGSCPTFYVRNANEVVLEAEGFSASVAPSLEALDVDALFRAQPEEGTLEIIMRNEALETHVVRTANLLLVPRQQGQRTFIDAGSNTENGCIFWQTRGLAPPTRASDDQGECQAALVGLDGLERSSQTDSTNLAAKETVDLYFCHVPEGDLGLVVAFRQTLLTTFLFYQTLAYMGRSAGTWFASLETAETAIKDKINGIGDVLGGIRVYVEEKEDVWRLAQEIRETGPLATNIEVVQLNVRNSSPLRIRLEMARGAWRLDMVALTRLENTAKASRLYPCAVLQNKSPNKDALRALLQDDEVLTTLPGDEYTLVYQLPEKTGQYDLFLESKGYYIEWIRDEWLHEENAAATAMMLFNPERAVVEMAPKYKRLEPRMEEFFWSSRYASP